MPRGVPKAGFRMTKNRQAKGFKPNKAGFKAAKKIASIPVLKQEFAAPVKHETDEQIRAKLIERFHAMDKMTDATVNGINKSLIISGPAGLGKSYGVMKIAEQYEKGGKKVTVVKGFVRPTGLYKVLYENRFKNCVVIFDDCDSVFHDDNALNLLKSACDMTRKREISWLSETNMEDEGGAKLPTKYEFEGSIVFITNIDFDALINKGNKNAVHFSAMISRSIYLDLAMHTRRDYMVRIMMVVEEGMLRDNGLSDFEAKELLIFIEKNCERLRELSLRMVLKISSLMKMDRIGWQQLARVTCFTGGNQNV
jgi:hypothetical protein